MKRSFLNSISGVFRIAVIGMCVLFATFQSKAQITVTATGAGPGPVVYPNLGAAFAQINLGTHTGAITISVTASYTEPTTATLNANAAPASYTSVLIKPAAAANPVITGNIAGNAVIFLFGATNVTIDGSNTVGGTTKNLSITNPQASGAVIRLGNNATTGASNNIIKNCKLYQTSSTTGGCVIYSGNGTAVMFPVSAALFPNSNNTIENDSIYNAQTGALIWGPAAFDDSWNVRKCSFSSLGFNGTQFNNCSNSTIDNNIYDAISINGGTQVSGILLSWACNNVTISRNKITNISNTFGIAAPNPQAEGIFITVNTATSSVNIINNFIANVTGVGNANVITNGHGILNNFAGTVVIQHNSIKMTTDQTSAAGVSAAICFGPGVTGTGDIRDNIIVNSQAIGNRYGMYSSVPSATYAPGMDYNDYFAISGNLGWIAGTPRTTLAAMIAGFGSNANSINLDPVFISPTDLHLQTVAINLPLAAGTPIATVPADIDGFNRSTTAPTIGAHELINKITYTPLANSCHDNFDTLSGVTIESPTGVPTAGGSIARIYFRKGTGTWFSTPGTMTSGSATNGTWRFIIDASMMGGVAGGDVISYYVVAQTVGGIVFGNPSAGLTAVDVNTITTPPTTPNSYTVNAVALTGFVLTNQLCFSPGSQTAPFSFTGTTGGPNVYTLTWSPVGGVFPVPAFTALPAAAITASVSPATAALPYFGTVVIRNNITGCQKVYNITLTINPPPNPIAGSLSMCISPPLNTLSSPGTPGGTWTSSNPSVATIGLTTGVVTGLLGGTSDITYTLPTGCKTYAGLTVITPPGPITGIMGTCPNLTTTLSNATPGGTWMSSNTTVATVDTFTGVVTGLVPGTSTIYYSITGCGLVAATVTVVANPNAIFGTLYACEGLTTTLATTSTGGTWISSSPGVATIGSTSGVVTGMSGGTATITYKYTAFPGCLTTNTVTIFPAASAIGGGPVVCQGLSVTLTNTVTPGTWQSSLPGVVYVHPTTGVATGVASAGTAVITYTTSNGCKTTTVMHISTAPTTIAGTNVVCSEYYITLTNGTPGGTWTSSNTAVAIVGSSSGSVYGVAGGTALISYTTLACNPVSYVVTVNQTPPPITGGTVLCNGSATVPSTTTVFNSTPGGVWTISTPPGGTAMISSGGVITGLYLGVSNVVTYTMATGCYRTAPIIVDTLPGPISGINSICPGRSTTFTTSSTGGVWSSANSSIASVVAVSGVVTGVATGTTTITYSALSSCYRTKPFIVTGTVPMNVTLTRNPPGDPICMGVPVTFTATPVNGGASPYYDWQLFGVDFVDTATVGGHDSAYTYVPTHGDVVRVFLYNSLDICSSPSPAYVDMPINIYPNVAPTVAISTGSPTTMSYLGQIVTFNSLVTWGGTGATYQWYVDGEAIAGATNNTFTRTVYDDDLVECWVNGHPECATGTTGKSNQILLIADWLKADMVADKNSTMSLFPNPNTGSFTLSGTLSSGINSELTYEVVNVLGQVVHKGTTTARNGVVSQQVKLTKDVAAGTYMLRVNAENESKVFHFVIGE